MAYVKFRKSIHSKEHKAIRDFLVDRRKMLGLSQQQLADRLGVIYSLIGKIETGDRRLDMLEFAQYCNALEVQSDEMLRLINQHVDIQ